MDTLIDRHAEFRTTLKSELDKRCASNPSYSLRAFAKKLEISHSGLSQLISGKRNPSPRMKARIMARINIEASSGEEQVFLSSLDLRSPKEQLMTDLQNLTIHG